MHEWIYFRRTSVIRNKTLTSKDKLLLQNARFYEAFELGDLDGMEAVWSLTGDVKCIHPGWLVLEGWPAVRDSWERIFSADANLKVSLRNVSATIIGQFGVVTLVEELTYSTQASSRTGSIMATNIFRNVRGEWKLIHHHGSPLMVADEDDGDQNFRYN